MQSGWQRIKELDALRGFAAISVVLFHYTMGNPLLERYFVWGVTGVDLFFMISGFVIFFTLQTTRSGGDFLVSRFSRLYPIYWVCVSFTAGCMWLNTFLTGREQADLLGTYGMNLTMLQHYFHVENLEWTYWTLAVEWQFYLFMWALFVLGQLRHIEWIGWAMLVLGGCFGTFLQGILPSVYETFKTYFLLLGHFPLFLAGILFYKLKFEGCTPMRCAQILACGVVQFCLFHHVGTSSWHLSDSRYAMALGGYFVVFFLLASGHLRFLVHKVPLYLGAISYPLYLTHLYFGFSFFIPLLINRCHFSYSAASLAITLPLVLFLSIGLHEGIEKPFTRSIRVKYRIFFDQNKKG